MNYRERKQLEQLIHVRAFGARRGADFPSDSLGGQAFAVVEDIVGRLRRVASEKDASRSAVSEKRTVKSSVRRALMNDLRAIARTARLIGITRPGVESKFRLKQAYSEQELLAAAKAFESGVTPMAAEFINYELPAIFLEDLRADIVAFEAALDDRNAALEVANHTQSDLVLSLNRGMEAVRQLDVIIRNKYRKDELTLNAWSRAVRPISKSKKAVGTKVEEGGTPSSAAA